MPWLNSTPTRIRQARRGFAAKAGLVLVALMPRSHSAEAAPAEDLFVFRARVRIEVQDQYRRESRSDDGFLWDEVNRTDASTHLFTAEHRISIGDEEWEESGTSSGEFSGAGQFEHMHRPSRDDPPETESHS